MTSETALAMEITFLGAASPTITSGGTRFLFSGDLGRDDAPLIPPPETPPAADWIVMEGTYGNREHPDADLEENLGEVARRTLGRGGVLMVPAFAVGRSQAILHAIYRLIDSGELAEVPVYLNSPMAIDVTKLYVRYVAYHRLSIEECRQAFGRVRLVRSVEESKALNRRRGPFIVVAGAGMLSGGRILHHLRAFGGERRNAILLTGYQAPGTRGAALLRGNDSLKVHGRQIPIRCEVAKLDGLSAHADRRGLLEWLEAIDGRPRGICLVHGEEPALESLAAAVTESGIETRIPDYRDTIELVS
ncbi:MAG: MBL fold metallo-hydrolase [Gemmatimonadales bacterium]